MTVVHVSRPDGAVLEVQIVGNRDAPTLLLLQGQASSHDWWTGIRDRYEDRFQTVTMDYRGTGATIAPTGELTTGLLADDASAVLDALDVDRADVYGTSMGGRVAQVLAAAHPEKVRSLVLACTSPGGAHATERSNDVRRELASPDEAARRVAMVRLFYSPAWGEDASCSHLFGDPTMSPADRQRHLRMSARHDAWDLLPDISSPTLVIHGSDDEMNPTHNSRLLANRIPGAQLYIHDGGRHGFFDEFAHDLDLLLGRFWTRSASS